MATTSSSSDSKFHHETPPPAAPRDTESAPTMLSTPIKHGTSTLNKFTTNQKYRVREMTDMGTEMKKFFVGPMPAGHFLNTFFPKEQLTEGPRAKRFYPGCFENSISAETEPEAYDPFVGSLANILIQSLN